MAGRLEAMRTNKTTVTCDRCGSEITKKVVTYGEGWLIPVAPWDGARDQWDFCSDDCLQDWLANDRVLNGAARERLSAAYRASQSPS